MPLDSSNRVVVRFPISRDPPEGGTAGSTRPWGSEVCCFQFLGIPPKGEQWSKLLVRGETPMFPISRDPPEGGTVIELEGREEPIATRFQFLGIPPKGEQFDPSQYSSVSDVSNF